MRGCEERAKGQLSQGCEGGERGRVEFMFPQQPVSKSFSFPALLPAPSISLMVHSLQ